MENSLCAVGNPRSASSCAPSVWQLFEQGWSIAAMAQSVGVNSRTVQRGLNKPKQADPQHRVVYGKTLVSPYQAYMLQRCAPSRRCVGRFKALQARGYKGSERTLSRYWNRLFKGEPKEEPIASSLPPLPLMAAPQPAAGQPPFSANRATWLLLRRTEPQTAAEKHLDVVLKASLHFAPAIELAQSFARSSRQRQADQFKAGLEQALHSSIPAFVNVAAGLQAAFEAVQAAMKLRVSKCSGCRADQPLQAPEAANVWASRHRTLHPTLFAGKLNAFRRTMTSKHYGTFMAPWKDADKVYEQIVLVCCTKTGQEPLLVS